jgi:FKBP-type peptidyl-prolyl cis-trans isomerase FklB
MNTKIVFSLGILSTLLLFACQTKVPTVAAEDLKTETDSISYALGANIGNSFRSQSLEVNPMMVAAGLQAAMDSASFLTADQSRDILMALNQRLNQRDMEKRQQENSVKAEQNKVNGDNFRAEYAKKAGVKTLPGGILYTVIKSGSGKTPKETDVVTVHYLGHLVDGQEFDSSFKRGEPVKFPVNGVIKGWQTALQSMKEGDKWEVVIPPDLGYGPQGTGEIIGPDATLVFEVELIKIENSK